MLSCERIPADVASTRGRRDWCGYRQLLRVCVENVRDDWWVRSIARSWLAVILFISGESEYYDVWQEGYAQIMRYSRGPEGFWVGECIESTVFLLLRSYMAV
jgi:hypothetical protein